MVKKTITGPDGHVHSVEMDEDGVEYLMDGEGNKSYGKDGKLHRENAPAYISATGHTEWWLNGKMHREDGPAFELDDGTQGWYRHGVAMSKDEIEKIKAEREK